MQAVFPRATDKRNKLLQNPISLVRDKANYIVGGAVLLPIKTVIGLFQSSRLIDLHYHKSSYRSILQE